MGSEVARPPRKDWSRLATVNDAACEAVARRLVSVPLNETEYFPDFSKGRAVARAEMLVYWLLVVGICQQTQNLRGTVNGVACRGSDYLFRRGFESLRERPDRWSPAALSTWSEEDLAREVSDDGRAESSTVDRLEERARMARDIGGQLLDRYAGDAERMFPRGEQRVGRMLAKLTSFEAYSDPLHKKSFLLLLNLHHIGLLQLRDPQFLGFPIDYHLMRVFLRAGMVVIGDVHWREALAAGRPATTGQEHAIRAACGAAGRRMMAAAPAALLHLDSLLWNIGRTCCARGHEPLCHQQVKCPKKPDGCSLIRSFHYACPDGCPLDGVCRTSLDGAGAEGYVLEPLIETHFY
ncbi:hypothetical protein HZA57_00915 [Candidatus Poribacteria bacterium]|nr:hypothetical protein [Candidatus Poribacteria bacterium]